MQLNRLLAHPPNLVSLVYPRAPIFFTSFFFYFLFFPSLFALHRTLILWTPVAVPSDFCPPDVPFPFLSFLFIRNTPWGATLGTRPPSARSARLFARFGRSNGRGLRCPTPVLHLQVLDARLRLPRLLTDRVLIPQHPSLSGRRAIQIRVPALANRDLGSRRLSFARNRGFRPEGEKNKQDCIDCSGLPFFGPSLCRRPSRKSFLRSLHSDLDVLQPSSPRSPAAGRPSKFSEPRVASWHLFGPVPKRESVLTESEGRGKKSLRQKLRGAAPCCSPRPSRSSVPVRPWVHSGAHIPLVFSCLGGGTSSSKRR